MTSFRLCRCIVALSFFFISCSDEIKKTSPHERGNNLEAVKAAIQKYPDSLMLIHELIELYRNEGRYDSAISLTDKQIKKDSGNAYLWNIKATLFFENEDTLKAIEALEHAIAIYPLPEYLAALGTIYAGIKDRNALFIADELLELDKPKYSKNAWFIKGMYYNFSNKPDSAILCLDQCLALDFSYMYAYREKAIALYHSGKYNEAADVLKRAVTIQNNFDEGYFWLGKVYEKLNQKEMAIQSYKNALLYDREYIEARTALEQLENFSGK